MKLFDRLKSAYLRFEDILMQNHSCLACGREVKDESFPICDECNKSLGRISGRLCISCGEELPEDSLVCEYCKDIKYEFSANHSYCHYGEIAKTLVKNFKYGGRRYYAKYLAKLMAEIDEAFDGIDYVTYVGVSSKKLRSRGFNQAKLLAEEICKLKNLELVHALSKDNTKVSQAGLSREERIKNPSGTFHLIESVKPIIKGKNILIIDDVFTTGSTLNECAKELKLAKTGKIKTLTFAKTQLVR